MFKAIFDKLNEHNLNPYAPGRHTGLCAKPYCVIKEGNQMPNMASNRIGQRKIDIIVFVPIASYIAMDPYIKQIRTALSELNNLRKTGFETQSIVDDEKKAYTSSIEYTVLRKLEG